MALQIAAVKEGEKEREDETPVTVIDVQAT